MASREHRGFWSSFQYVTLILGQLLALAVLIVLQQWVLTPAQLQRAWGWRIPFVIGALCAVTALYLRRNMAETESFERSRKRKAQTSSLRALLRHPRAILTVVGLTLGGTVAFYTYTTYMLKFLVNSVGMDKATATLVSAATLFLYMCLQPMVEALSDRIGRRPILIAFGVLGSVLTVPILNHLGEVTDAFEAFALIMLALLIVSGYTAINAVVKAELFPVEIRALGVGCLCPDGVAVWRHRRVRGALAQEHRAGTGLLLVCHGLHRGFPAGVPVHAGDSPDLADRSRSPGWLKLRRTVLPRRSRRLSPCRAACAISHPD